jgi:hypothetical protein
MKKIVTFSEYKRFTFLIKPDALAFYQVTKDYLNEIDNISRRTTAESMNSFL